MNPTRLIASLGQSGGIGQNGALAPGGDQGVVRAAVAALDAGAALVELRADLMAGEEALGVASSLPRGRWLATIRTRREGGASGEEWAARWRKLRAIAACGAGALDVEFADLAVDEGRAKEVAKFAAGCGCQLVVSFHDWAEGRLWGEGRSWKLEDQLRAMESVAPGAVAKVAWQCGDIRENFAAMEAMRSRPGRRIVVCMGENGVLSRVLAAKFGAWGTFCAGQPGSPTAPGQLSVGQMLDCFRFGRQGAETAVFGVIGSPVGQSVSPALFNDQFAAAEVDGVYVPLRIDSGEELIGFLEGCRERPWFGARGFSVTVPHKGTVLEWSGVEADALSRRIGAANTLRFEPDGQVKAFNTDYAGALAALGEAMSLEGRDGAGLNAAVLGAGGVARAVVGGLSERGWRVTVHNRSRPRAEALAAAFGCRAEAWEGRGRLEADVVVNCTSVGMAPGVEETPLPAEALRAGMVVFDTVYNPRETRLLREARAAGCRTVDGVSMFVQQAAAQYRLWTGKEPDLGRMEAVATRELATRAGLAGGGEAE